MQHAFAPWQFFDGSLSGFRTVTRFCNAVFARMAPLRGTLGQTRDCHARRGSARPAQVLVHGRATCTMTEISASLFATNRHALARPERKRKRRGPAGPGGRIRLSLPRRRHALSERRIKTRRRRHWPHRPPDHSRPDLVFRRRSKGHPGSARWRRSGGLPGH